MNDVYEFIVKTLSEVCKVSAQDIEPSLNLFSDLGIDSVDFLDAVYSIDKQFGIRIPIGQWMSAVNEGESGAVDYFVMENFVDAVSRLASAVKA
ncbi:acyl carrier protein [Chromobacterium sp. IIBBL 290-4]|uniref:acyl carrier protein n=1 Tax=Chromobacterium sp. IIBBL 290-4 TaxID=2953890 RepID=UPI0020B81D55|nr:acyl carrier protein [Chromobacterium sp. IIBBL 290-4]UTH76436.1 acyl carrier protein [Chromobacterium sp. IIBBL 290-4]